MGRFGGGLTLARALRLRQLLAREQQLAAELVPFCVALLQTLPQPAQFGAQLGHVRVVGRDGGDRLRRRGRHGIGRFGRAPFPGMQIPLQRRQIRLQAAHFLSLDLQGAPRPGQLFGVFPAMIVGLFEQVVKHLFHGFNDVERQAIANLEHVTEQGVALPGWSQRQNPTSH